jgi:type II secretory pathway component GspD/PulD (secretin)
METVRRLALTWAIWMLASLATVQAASLEIIQLHHRPADEIIPIIQPFLARDDVIRGSGFQLIIRTSPERLAQVRKILARIDRAPRRLLITVRHSASSLDRSSGAGARVRGDREQLHGTVQVYRTEERDDAAAEQRVQVLEGKRAFIRTGQRVPLGGRSVVTAPGGAAVQDSVRYRAVTSGFYVVPRVTGDQVTLRIMPRRASLSRGDGGRVNVQEAATTVRGRIGQWITIGGTADQSGTTAGSVVQRTESRSENRGAIQVKVDPLP